nr:crystal protein-like [Megalopta genalis]
MKVVPAFLFVLLTTRVRCYGHGGTAVVRTAVVRTASGPVRGYVEQTQFRNLDYSIFKGIPFAEPPLGNLRFRAPVPIAPWTEVLDATEEGPICPQIDKLIRRALAPTGDEDCLRLNVYSPLNFESKTKYPTMVFVYGGAYVEGYKDQVLYGPDLFIEEGAIVVTFNYRLGVLGFLSLGIPEALGNAAMKDQVLALKWAPVPIAPWTEVLDATEEGPICPQIDKLIRRALAPTGDEDCLRLNVYSPALNFESKTKYPTMVFVYGGAYVEGYKDQVLYGPDLFIEEGAIVVTFNYRLGVLGFLSLGIPEALGNAAMKDQVLALKWVQRNIEKFGGDPRNVTLFGESAGSSSVILHELSRRSEGDRILNTTEPRSSDPRSTIEAPDRFDDDVPLRSRATSDDARFDLRTFS